MSTARTVKSEKFNRPVGSSVGNNKRFLLFWFFYYYYIIMYSCFFLSFNLLLFSTVVVVLSWWCFPSSSRFSGEKWTELCLTTFVISVVNSRTYSDMISWRAWKREITSLYCEPEERGESRITASFCSLKDPAHM